MDLAIPDQVGDALSPIAYLRIWIMLRRRWESRSSVRPVYTRRNRKISIYGRRSRQDQSECAISLEVSQECVRTNQNAPFAFGALRANENARNGSRF